MLPQSGLDLKRKSFACSLDLKRTLAKSGLNLKRNKTLYGGTMNTTRWKISRTTIPKYSLKE